MKMYFVADARMPTEKAHGIHIAKMCEGFIEAGLDVVLVVPDRPTDPRSVKEFYGLRVEVPVVRLPVLNWYNGGRIGYRLASLSFMRSYVRFLRQRELAGEQFVLYTVDTDDVASSALGKIDAPLYSEMHGGKRNTRAMRYLFTHARGIIPINNTIKEELARRFPNSPAKYLVEPNGVDLSMFVPIDRAQARAALHLPQDKTIVMYTGRFFDWKGLELLPQAAAQTPEYQWYLVGGTKEEFKELVPGTSPSNVVFAGSQPYSEMPRWIAAANALVVLGTKRDQQSYYYTSPMKLFEYMAMGASVAASKTPAIESLVSDKEVIFWEPDKAEDLAAKVRYAVNDRSRTAAAVAWAQSHTWRARAERIAQFIRDTK